MRSPPADLVPERLGKALAEGWRLRAASMEYVPEGGGSYHWKLTDEDGQPHFVTVDDLDDKDWMGDTREAVFEGLRRALSTAAALRYEVGLEFVVAPIAARDGELLRRLDDRYTVSVFPFLAGLPVMWPVAHLTGTHSHPGHVRSHAAAPTGRRRGSRRLVALGQGCASGRLVPAVPWVPAWAESAFSIGTRMPSGFTSPTGTLTSRTPLS